MRGITPEAAIGELEKLRTSASTTTRPLGTNALSKHLKETRELAARATISSSTSGGCSSSPVVNPLSFAFVLKICANSVASGAVIGT